MVKLSEFQILHLEDFGDDYRHQQPEHQFKQLKVKKLIEALHRGQPTILLINSSGGCGECGYDLAGAIKVNGKVYAVVTGICNSMAIVVLQACYKRIIFPSATLLFHSMDIMPQLFILDLEDETFRDALLPQALGIQARYEEVVAERCGLPPGKIKDLCLQGHKEKKIFSAEEAKVLNLVDDILDFELNFDSL